MISVAIPVYNTKPAFLLEAIQSIISQTYTEFELMILNDGSTYRDTLAFLSIVETLDPRIRYINFKQNQGIAKIGNAIFSLAKYDLIARLDSDDIALPTRLEKQVKYMLDNPNVDILGTGLNFYQYDEKNGWYKGQSQAFYPQIDKHIATNSMWFIHQPCCMFRKNMGIFYDEKIEYFAEDFDLFIRAIKQGKVLHNLDEYLNLYRLHGNSLSSHHFSNPKHYDRMLLLRKTLLG